MDIVVQLKIVMEYLRPGVAGLIRHAFVADFPALGAATRETSLEACLLDCATDDWIEGVREALRRGARNLRGAVCEALFNGHTRCAVEIHLSSASWGVRTQQEMVLAAAEGGSLAATSLALSWSRIDMCDLALMGAARRGRIDLMRVLRGRGALAQNRAFVIAAGNGAVASLAELDSWSPPNAFSLRRLQQKCRGQSAHPLRRGSHPAPVDFESWVPADAERWRLSPGAAPAAPPTESQKDFELALEAEDLAHHKPTTTDTKAVADFRKAHYHNMFNAASVDDPYTCGMRAAVANYQVGAADWIWKMAPGEALRAAARQGYLRRGPPASKSASDELDRWMVEHVPGIAVAAAPAAV